MCVVIRGCRIRIQGPGGKRPDGRHRNHHPDSGTFCRLAEGRSFQHNEERAQSYVLPRISNYEPGEAALARLRALEVRAALAVLHPGIALVDLGYPDCAAPSPATDRR